MANHRLANFFGYLAWKPKLLVCRFAVLNRRGRQKKMFEYLRKFRENFPNRKFYQLIDKIYDFDNLEDAWTKVKANKGCAGVDEQSIFDFWLQKDMYLREIQRAIKKGTYKATPVLRKHIPKSDNEFRPLGIPTVKDRIIQQAVKNVIEQIFDYKFLDCSYGFRPDKSAHQAIEQITENLEQGFTWVIDGDIKSFFDTVNHELLMKLVTQEISDGKVLNLLESWLKAEVLIEGKLQETKEGTPQGGVISPLLANIYLHEFDTELIKYVNVRLVRYADDFVVMCKTKWMAENTMKAVKEALCKLKLHLNKDKTRIVNAEEEEFEFLGFRFKKFRGKIKMIPRQKSIKKFKDSVRKITKRKQPIKPQDMTWRINRVIRGWGNYFKIGNVKPLFSQLDVWIRMRCRMFIEKKKSRYAHQRVPNYVLKSEYKLASLMTLIKPLPLQWGNNEEGCIREIRTYSL